MTLSRFAVVGLQAHIAFSDGRQNRGIYKALR